MPPIMSEPNSAQAPYGRAGNGDGRSYGKKAKSADIDMNRLVDAMRASRRALRHFREERTKAVRELVGSHWSESANRKRVPINLLARYVQVVSRALVPKSPRAMLTTRVRANQPAVSAMQDWMNQRIIESYFADKLQRWVTDALLCMGIMKVALATPGDAASSGYVNEAGVPFAEVVDLDDFVYDLGCRDFSQASFLGHRYRMPLEVAKSLDYFNKNARARLSADDNRTVNQDGDPRIDTLGNGWEAVGPVRDFEPTVELWEVYLPRTKRVVTLRSDGGGVPSSDEEPLRVQEWLGPPCGPYHFLAFQTVPGNAMPKGPIMDLVDLHEFVNHLYRKLVNQAQRQKEVLPVSGAQLDDGKKVVQASDGDMIGVDNPAAIRPVSYGGPSAVNANFAVHLKDLFSAQAGNLDLLSGASPQSKTASQDKMLNDNASAGVADMQEKTVVGTANVLSAWGWYWWNHPQEVMTTSRTLPGLPDISIERRLSPASAPASDAGMKRIGRWEDLHCRVDPYSMVYRTPLQRIQFLSSMIKEMGPLMPMLQQQGIGFDMQFYLKKVAEYADEPDVTGLFTIQEPPPQTAGMPTSEAPGMPAQTERTYIRRSVGSDTQANRQAEMANAAAAEASAQE